MKRLFSIPLILLILFSGINVNIAAHYCGGNFSASKVSLNGTLASCGMEHQAGSKSFQDLISNHCCEDFISSLAISVNYIPSICHSIPDIAPELNHLFILTDELLNSQCITVSSICGNNKPPGNFSPVSVEQQVICIFQI